MGARRSATRKTRASAIMTEYFLVRTSMDFLSLGSGADISMILVDNSVRFNKRQESQPRKDFRE